MSRVVKHFSNGLSIKCFRQSIISCCGLARQVPAGLLRINVIIPSKSRNDRLPDLGVRLPSKVTGHPLAWKKECPKQAHRLKPPPHERY